jgi:hypothetical protein
MSFSVGDRLSYLVELPECEDLGANIDDSFEWG